MYIYHIYFIYPSFREQPLSTALTQTQNQTLTNPNPNPNLNPNPKPKTIPNANSCNSQTAEKSQERQNSKTKEKKRNKTRVGMFSGTNQASNFLTQQPRSYHRSSAISRKSINLYYSILHVIFYPLS